MEGKDTEAEELIKFVGDHVTKANELVDEVEESHKEERKRKEEQDERDKKLSPLKKEIEWLRTEKIKFDQKLEKKSNKVLRLMEDLNRLRQNLALSSETLPELQAAKTIAVNNRNFKEASRLVKEIKQAETEKAEWEEQIALLQTKQDHSRSQLQTLNDQQQQIANQLQTAEFSHDSLLLEAFSVDLQRLKTVLQALIETDSFEQAEVVNNELSLLITESEALYIKHNLPIPDSHNLIVSSLSSDPLSRSSSASSAPLSSAAKPTSSVFVFGDEDEDEENERTEGVEASAFLEGEEVKGQDDDEIVEDLATIEKQIEEAVLHEDFDLADKLEQKRQRLSSLN